MFEIRKRRDVIKCSIPTGTAGRKFSYSFIYLPISSPESYCIEKESYLFRVKRKLFSMIPLCESTYSLSELFLQIKATVTQGCKSFSHQPKKTESHSKILGARRPTRSTFHHEYPKI
jgi:hypothetical protein